MKNVIDLVPSEVIDQFPSLAQHVRYQSAWQYFNYKLFEGSLNPCFLNFNAKVRKCHGFFQPEVWILSSNEDFKIHEISLHPESVGERELIDIFATLVHEMCHQARYDWWEKKPSGGYHCKKWVDLMIGVGLIPFNGRGGMTGNSVSHTIESGGKYEQCFQDMPVAIKQAWMGQHKIQKAKVKKSKYKFNCACSKRSLWGKPTLKNVVCSICGEEFVSEELENVK